MERPVDQRAARRVMLVGRIALGWAAVIVLRLLWLQVVKHEEYVKLAKSQQQHQIDIPADRGEILDRRGRPLAVSIRTESLAVNPQLVADPRFFAGAVAPVVGVDAAQLAASIEEYKARAAKKEKGRSYLQIKRHLTLEEKDRLQYLKRLQPIEILRDSRRLYPNGKLAAHVVGSVDADGNGNSGIEQKLNDELKGKPGKMVVLTDSQQQYYVSWVSEESVQGANVTLSLDSVIQQEAEDALRAGMAEANAASGTVIALEVPSGAVLAAANLPDFDPRHTVPTPQEAAAMHTNIAVQLPCEPGSVMKMITVTGGIGSGAYTPESPIYCENGAYPRPNRPAIHDVHPYGTLDVAGVLIKSSNIGVAKIAIGMGRQRLDEYLAKFGIGQRTGIELPAESRGILRPLECKGPKDRYCWSPTSHEYIAFGHEVSATAFQLARAVNVIASGGYLIQPRLVMSKERPTADGRVEQVPSGRPDPVRTIPAELAYTIRKIMERVVLEGTGKRAALAGYSSAGKTGSAEIFENKRWIDRHNSSFIGFAPVANPKIVVVVTLNRTPKQGGIAAAPVFKRVAQTALRVLNVPKDRPETDTPAQSLRPTPKEAPLTRIASAGPAAQKLVAVSLGPAPPSPLLEGPRVPDFRGKSVLAVMHECAALNLDVRIAGRGYAYDQRPAPGEIVPLDGRMRVEFRERR